MHRRVWLLAALLAAARPALAQTRPVPVPVQTGAPAVGVGAGAGVSPAAPSRWGASSVPAALNLAPTLGRPAMVRPAAWVSPVLNGRGTRVAAGARPVLVLDAASELAIGADAAALPLAGLPSQAVAGATLKADVLPAELGKAAPKTGTDARALVNLALAGALAPRGFDGDTRVLSPLADVETLPARTPRFGRPEATGSSDRAPEGKAGTVPSPSSGGEGRDGRRPSLRQRFGDWIPPKGERLAILLVAPLWNAFVIGAAYLINPIRLAFLQLDFGLTGVAASYIASGGALGISFWLYSKLAHLPRAKIVTIATVGLGATLVGWWGVASLLAAYPSLSAWTLTTPWFTGPSLGKVFSFTFNLFGDVFAMMSVTVAGTYIVDVFRGWRAKRYFPVIFGAGSLGGLIASAFVLLFVKSIGPLPIMLISAGVYLSTLAALAYLERWSKDHPSEAREEPARTAASQEGPRLFSEGLLRRFPILGRVEALVPDVVKLVLSNPLLQLLFVLKLLERIVPDFANFAFESEMRAMFPGSAYRDAASAFRATFALWQQGASFLTGMLLSTVLIKRIGIGWSAASSPIANAVGLAAYAVAPGMVPAYALNQAEGGLRYVVMKPAVERGWAQVPKRVVFLVKAFIDSFTYRGLGKIISGITLLILGPKVIGLSAATIAGIGVPLAIFAAYNALRFGKEVQRLEAEREAAAAKDHAAR